MKSDNSNNYEGKRMIPKKLEWQTNSALKKKVNEIIEYIQTTQVSKHSDKDVNKDKYDEVEWWKKKPCKDCHCRCHGLEEEDRKKHMCTCSKDSPQPNSLIDYLTPCTPQEQIDEEINDEWKGDGIYYAGKWHKMDCQFPLESEANCTCEPRESSEDECGCTCYKEGKERCSTCTIKHDGGKKKCKKCKNQETVMWDNNVCIACARGSVFRNDEPPESSIPGLTKEILGKAAKEATKEQRKIMDAPEPAHRCNADISSFEGDKEVSKSCSKCGKRQIQLSTCCHAPIRLGQGDENTNWHMCTKCNKPCDIKLED